MSSSDTIYSQLGSHAVASLQVKVTAAVGAPPSVVVWCRVWKARIVLCIMEEGIPERHDTKVVVGRELVQGGITLL